LNRFITFFTDPSYSSEHKVKVLQVLIIPALIASFRKQESEEVIDAALVSAIVNNILDSTSNPNAPHFPTPLSSTAASPLSPPTSPHSGVPYDEALNIEILQLVTHLIQ